MAASEIKNYSPSFTAYPVYNESIEELRVLCDLELADIALFREMVAQFKRETEDYIRVGRDIEN